VGETAKLHLDLEALIGSTIHDRYQVETLLGVGGMGAVFKGRHTGLQRGVAIKVLHPEIGRDPSVSKRFDREAHSASRLDHPNCVRVTDFGTTENGTKYLVMELLEGGDLDGRLGQPWPPDRAVATIEQVLHGLEHAHHVGIVHRDLKPENIFVTRDFRGEEVIKIVDFGIAKLLDEQGSEKLTRQGVVFGTPRYMSPEQAAGGKIDERTDLYAVGLILYELLAGRPPFEADDAAQLLRMHIMAPPPPLPASVPEPLAKIVEKLLEKSKSDRFASAREVLDALSQLRGLLANAAVAAAPIVSGSPASSGVAWQPATEPTPVIRGGTLVAETGELAAVSLSAAARAITRTGSHAGVGQPATGPFPSLATGSHPSVADSHPSSVAITQPSVTDGSSPSLAGASGWPSGASGSSGPWPGSGRSRRVLPFILAAVTLLLVLAGVAVLLSGSDDEDQAAKTASPPAAETSPTTAEQQPVVTSVDASKSQTADSEVVAAPTRDYGRESGRTPRPNRSSGKSDGKPTDGKPADPSTVPEHQTGGPTDSTAPAGDEADPREPEPESEADAEQQKPERNRPGPDEREPEHDRGKGRGNDKGKSKDKGPGKSKKMDD